MYVLKQLNQEIIVSHIVTLHFYQYNKDFYFSGESHDFWELVYIDNGEIEVTAGENTFIAKKGDIIFHKPLEFHALRTYNNTSPNLAIISFKSSSDKMEKFNNKVLKADQEDVGFISNIFKEGELAFTPPPTVMNEELKKASNAPFAFEQLIKIHIEQLLITLYRKHFIGGYLPHTHNILSNKSFPKSNIYINHIIRYLQENICSNLSVADMCQSIPIGRSSLQALFKKEFNCGVIEYFTSMKINYAKMCLREGNLNISEISNHLSFSSVAYFSKCFKSRTNMSPKEYANSISQLSKHMTTYVPEIRGVKK